MTTFYNTIVSAEQNPKESIQISSPEIYPIGSHYIYTPKIKSITIHQIDSNNYLRTFLEVRSDPGEQWRDLSYIEGVDYNYNDLKSTGDMGGEKRLSDGTIRTTWSTGSHSATNYVAWLRDIHENYTINFTNSLYVRLHLISRLYTNNTLNFFSFSSEVEPTVNDLQLAKYSNGDSYYNQQNNIITMGNGLNIAEYTNVVSLSIKELSYSTTGSTNSYARLYVQFLDTNGQPVNILEDNIEIYDENDNIDTNISNYLRGDNKITYGQVDTTKQFGVSNPFMWLAPSSTYYRIHFKTPVNSNTIRLTLSSNPIFTGEDMIVDILPNIYSEFSQQVQPSVVSLLENNPISDREARKLFIKRYIFNELNYNTYISHSVPALQLGIKNLSPEFNNVETVALFRASKQSDNLEINLSELEEDGFYAIFENGDSIKILLQNDKSFVVTRTDSDNNEEYFINGLIGLEPTDFEPSSNLTFSYGNVIVVDKFTFVIGSFSGTETPYVTGSGSGDPYIYPINGNVYKLPNNIAFYRFLEFDDVIINVDITKLTEKEKQTITDVSKEFNISNPEINGVYFNQFLIKIKDEYVLFDRYLNIISTNIDDNSSITITPNDKEQIFKCPIQGTSSYTSLEIKADDIFIDLHKYSNPQMINGINVHLPKNKQIYGLMASDTNPRYSRIKKLTDTRHLKDFNCHKHYKKTFNENWVKVI